MKQLGVADNLLEELPTGLGHLPALQKLWAYGNRLRGTQAVRCLTWSSDGDDPPTPANPSASSSGSRGDSDSDITGSSGYSGSGVTGGSGAIGSGGMRPLWPCLDSVWLEGNPLEPQAVLELLTCVPVVPHLKSLGLDLNQVQEGGGGVKGT